MAIIIPECRFEVYDSSAYEEITQPEVSIPYQVYAFSSDKGPEEFRSSSIVDFFKCYGDRKTISFEKHGQPLIQAASVADSGGLILCKRVVAKDATLANAIVYAKIEKLESTQKVDEDGKKVYTDVDGNEVNEDAVEAAKEQAITNGTSTPLFEPVMLETVPKISYIKKSIAECKNVSEIQLKMDKDLDENTYPLFVIYDIGRGVSKKSFNIVPDYITSKARGYMKYVFNVIENGSIIESLPFAFNHNIIEAEQNISIQNVARLNSYQIRAKVFENSVDAFIDKVAEISGLSKEYLLVNDILNAKAINNSNIPEIEIDNTIEDAINLQSVYGTELENGSNGAFGEKPFGTEAYEQQLLEFYNGEYTDSIYDLDNYKFDLFIDANYPLSVKKAIEDLNEFRRDAVVLRDAGIKNNTTLEEVLTSHQNCTSSELVSKYSIYYDIIDPFSKKQITVTIGYSLAKIMIDHFKGGRSRATAGITNGFVLRDAIENTINFIPKKTPKVNQKEKLAQAKINYAGYYEQNSLLVVETLFTAQEKTTQLSSLNNVLAIQEVIKAIREKCPYTRYSSISTSDLDSYRSAIDPIIEKFKSNFVTLELKYIQDTTYADNNVYTAAINVQCKRYDSAELFKIYVKSDTI